MINRKFNAEQAQNKEGVSYKCYRGFKVKRRIEATCKRCELTIYKGDYAMKIEKTDGFMTVIVGYCHPECFENFAKENYKKNQQEN